MNSFSQPQRADVALVERGFFESRARAQAAIAAGLVSADGVVVCKPSVKISTHAVISAQPPYPWVSRGGVKLAYALDIFGIDPKGMTCLDIGASTGGFCDVLLKAGARHVVAVDVGKGQLHPRLAQDERITLLESRDARALTPDDLMEKPQLVVCDVSFISLLLILPHVLPLAAEGAWLAALVKPQFEVGPAFVGKGGLVKDEHAREAACQRVRARVSELGWALKGFCSSPITGHDGNQEFLLGAYRE
jgi:23S rRNA (cytidine1920-2'-O)/16S rRNA (cytidine1409-2'-O)-methyltransferase